MIDYRDYEITCEDRRDMETRRVAFKTQMKREGLFLRCEGDVVILNNRSRYIFVVKPSVPDIEDEHLPKEAFYGAERGGGMTKANYSDMARKIME